MTPLADLPFPDRFAYYIEALYKAIGMEERQWRIARPLLALLWLRLRRISKRFNAVLARFNAGTLPPPGAPRRRRAPRPPKPPMLRPAVTLPRKFGLAVHWI